VLRSQLGKGPLALLDLRGFTLPDQIFSVDSAVADRALIANTGNNDMDGVE
jgi:type VI secretion system protein ImpL